MKRRVTYLVEDASDEWLHEHAKKTRRTLSEALTILLEKAQEEETRESEPEPAA